MQLLWWIAAGLVAGWLAGESLKGEGYGRLTDVAMGICGAVVGGLIISSAGFNGLRGGVITTLAAMITAALLTLLAGFANGRTVYARQL